MRAPARDSAEQAASKAAATSGASPSNTCERGTSRRSPSTGIGAGASAGSPAITASAIAQHAMLLASGPIESSVVESGDDAVARDAVLRRLEPGEAAQRRRDAHRAAGIAADRDDRLPIADRHRRAGGRAAGDQAAVVRIAGRAVMRVDADARRMRTRSCWCGRPAPRRRCAAARRPGNRGRRGGASSSAFEAARLISPATSNRSLIDTGSPASGEAT